TGDGGGMYFAADDTFVTNMTVSGNTAGGHGGGLYLAAPGSYGPSGFGAMTIASNSAPTGGAGGIWRAPVGESGSDVVEGSIASGNAHGAFEVGNQPPAAPEPPYKKGSIPDPNKPRTGPCGVILQGTSGPDTLTGTPVRNEIHGGRGNDRIFGMSGDDCLFGGLGDDLVRGANGADVIHGGAGNDTLYGGRGRDAIHGETGN